MIGSSNESFIVEVINLLSVEGHILPFEGKMCWGPQAGGESMMGRARDKRVMD